jgi:hypothetical protein
MTDDDRKRIATQAARGMSSVCGKPISLAPGVARYAEVNLCTARVRMTGLYPAGETTPTIIIRCPHCDTWRPNDDE